MRRLKLQRLPNQFLFGHHQRNHMHLMTVLVKDRPVLRPHYSFCCNPKPIMGEKRKESWKPKTPDKLAKELHNSKIETSMHFFSNWSVGFEMSPRALEVQSFEMWAYKKERKKIRPCPRHVIWQTQRRKIFFYPPPLSPLWGRKEKNRTLERDEKLFFFA